MGRKNWFENWKVNLHKKLSTTVVIWSACGHMMLPRIQVWNALHRHQVIISTSFYYCYAQFFMLIQMA